MDVLIKNMTLPTEDEQVNITILSDGSVIEHFRNESGKWSSYRSGGVTAIELPPHGRLIDADMLFQTYDGFSEDYYERLGEIRDTIINAPTVLEAST